MYGHRLHTNRALISKYMIARIVNKPQANTEPNGMCAFKRRMEYTLTHTHTHTQTYAKRRSMGKRAEFPIRFGHFRVGSWYACVESVEFQAHM